MWFLSSRPYHMCSTFPWNTYRFINYSHFYRQFGTITSCIQLKWEINEIRLSKLTVGILKRPSSYINIDPYIIKVTINVSFRAFYIYSTTGIYWCSVNQRQAEPSTHIGKSATLSFFNWSFKNGWDLLPTNYRFEKKKPSKAYFYPPQR